MAKTVSFVDVYQADISIRLQDNLPVALDIIYGLVDTDGVKWTPKSLSGAYSSFGPNIRAKIDALIVSGANIAKAAEGL